MPLPSSFNPTGNNNDSVTLSWPSDAPYRNLIAENYGTSLNLKPFPYTGYKAELVLKKITGNFPGADTWSYVLAGLGGGYGSTDWFRNGSMYILCQGATFTQAAFIASNVSGGRWWNWDCSQDLNTAFDVTMRWNENVAEGIANWPRIDWYEKGYKSTRFRKTLSWNVNTNPIPIKVTLVPGMSYNFCRLYVKSQGNPEIEILPYKKDENHQYIRVYIDGSLDKEIEIPTYQPEN